MAIERIYAKRLESGKIYSEFTCEEDEVDELPTDDEIANGSMYKVSGTGVIGDYTESTKTWGELFSVKE